MKKIFYLYSKSLLSKLALMAMLIVGGGNFAWADTTIVNGNTISTDWNNGANTINNTPKYQNGSNESSIWSLSAFDTSNSEFITTNNEYSWFSINSKDKVTIGKGQTIDIVVMGLNSSSSQMIFAYSDGSVKTNNKNDLTKAKEWYTEIRNSTSEYITLTVDNITEGEYYLQLIAKNVKIISITIKDASTPVLTVFPTTDATFGSVSATPASKTYTVTNSGAGSMDVTISNTNTTDFTISKTSMTGLTAGSSETFTVNFNYNAESLGVKSATITVTPSYDSEDAVVISATATAMSDNDPELSLSPDEDFDFGSLTANASKTYTVTNTGTGNLSVTITSSNSDDFTLSSDDFTESTTTIEGIATGESAEFTVTFNYTCAIANFGEHHSTITVTPSYDEGEAKSFVVSATSTADVVLDENNSTSWTSGSKTSIWVKIQPSSGWNTCCIPMTTTTYAPYIFGENAKFYALKSYSDGILSFEKKNYLGANVPCLVYIENAPNNNNGVLLSNINITSSSSGTVGSSTNNGATFKGTYVTKTYNEATDVETPWYGVTPSGKVMKAGAGANIKGYRAYFTGISAPSTPGARITLVFEDGGETTDLGFVKMVDPEAQDVYTLSGQKVKKGSKGIYIVNGRKVVIK